MYTISYMIHTGHVIKIHVDNQYGWSYKKIIGDLDNQCKGSCSRS